MYQALLICHSLFRWLVLASLLLAIYRAWRGYRKKTAFSVGDDRARHWTATIAHLQLTIGMVLYFHSPIVKQLREAPANSNIIFFSVIHPVLMFTAIVLITIGSSGAKRTAIHEDKFLKMLLWFIIALVILLVAIPWPFSPLANRPYYR